MTGLWPLFIRLVHILTNIIWRFMPASYRKKNVSNDIALITGAGSGVGRILAIRFSKLGSTVVLWDSNEEENLKTAKIIADEGLAAFTYTCDLSNKEEIYKTAEKVKHEIGRVTILVNSARLFSANPLLDTRDRAIEKIFAVNSLAHFWTIKAFLPDMISMDKGHIVTIASLAGHIALNCPGDYCASQAALLALHDGLQRELRTANKTNINMTMICPYLMNEDVGSKYVSASEPYQIVDKMLLEILLDSKLVIIPDYLYIIVILKAVLPYGLYNWVYDKLFQTKQVTANSQNRNSSTEKQD